MNWVTRVRNAIPFIAKRETAETLWHKCKGCEAMIFLKEFEENQSVCPKCDHHGRIGPAARFEALFDDESYIILKPPVVGEDPLKFRDTKKYVDRIKAARLATGETDAMKTAQTVASMSLPIAMMTKESVNRAYETSMAEGIRFERRVFLSMFATQDQKEGMAAFVDKRPPQFKNR